MHVALCKASQKADYTTIDLGTGRTSSIDLASAVRDSLCL
jgi:hypothetical protein